MCGPRSACEHRYRTAGLGLPLSAISFSMVKPARAWETYFGPHILDIEQTPHTWLWMVFNGRTAHNIQTSFNSLLKQPRIFMLRRNSEPNNSPASEDLILWHPPFSDMSTCGGVAIPRYSATLWPSRVPTAACSKRGWRSYAPETQVLHE